MWWIEPVQAAPPPVVAMEDRVELELAVGDEVRTVACGPDAAVVVAVHDATVSLYSFDGALRPGWSTAWTAPEPVRVVGADADDDQLWVLLHRGGRPDIHVLRVDLATGAVAASDHVVPVRRLYAAEDLVVTRDGAHFIAQNGWGYGTVVFVPREGEPLAVPPPEVTRGRKTWVRRVSETDGVVDVSMSTRKRGEADLVAARVEGTRTEDVVVLRAVPGDARNWVDGQVVDLPDGRRWLVGTWARGDKGVTSQGLFVADVAGEAAIEVKTTSFTDLAHFFDHLPAARREALAAKIEKKQAAGGDVAVGYGLRVHDAFVVGTRVVLVAEAFVAQYHTQTRTVTTVVNGVTTTTTQSYQVFDGWRFTHAIAVAYAPDRTIVWDASVPMGDILTTDLRPRVRAAVDGDRITLGYVANGRYSARTFQDGVEVDATRRARIETEAGERVVRGWAERTELWGEDAFLVSGFQKVEDGAGKRRVFALARVEAED